MEVTADFMQCYNFFVSKAQQADEFGDEQANEIEEFVQRYDNSAQITQLLWQLYYLQLELESEQTAIQEVQD